jgi:hypothetical protein
MAKKIMIQILKINFSQNFWAGCCPAAIINMPLVIGGPRVSSGERTYRLYTPL